MYRREASLVQSPGKKGGSFNDPQSVELARMVIQQKQEVTVRGASPAGDILIAVTAEDGQKVLVDLYDQTTVVELQLYRAVRFVDLPNDIQIRYGVKHNAIAVYRKMAGTSILGFTFDGSCRRMISLEDLPDGQAVDVLPKQDQQPTCVSATKPRPVLYDPARAAVPVAA